MDNCFWFGKYNGVPVSDVIKRDSGYIKWCLKNISPDDLGQLGITEDLFPKDLVYVYRLYGFSDQLLYVGQTLNIEDRLETHTERFVFKTVKYQLVDNKEDALNLEAYLISTLCPQFNKMLIKGRVNIGSELKDNELITYDFKIPDYCGIFWNMLSEVGGLKHYGDLKKYINGSPRQYGSVYYYGMYIKDIDFYSGYYEYCGKSKMVVYCKDDSLYQNVSEYLDKEGVTVCRSSKEIINKIPNKLLVAKLSKGWIGSKEF